MEATVLSVGKSVLSGALSYAQSALAEEVALQLGVRRDQAFITDELEMMQGFLMSVHEEGRDGSSKVVKIWVKQVRDVAYDVEDCLLDFAVRLDHQPSWWRISRRLLDRRHVAKEMKDLRSKVEDISQRNVRYRLIRESSGQPSSATANISSEVLLHVAEAKTRAALHMDEEKVDLAKLIVEDGDDRGSAIAVWGASSDFGVTSIIRAAYDNQQVKDKFKCRAWVRLMHPFNPNDLFDSLVRQFYQDSGEESGKASMQGGATAAGLTVLKKMAAPDHSLVDEFNRYVTEKRYLVVIADVSTIEEWDWIKTYFPSMTGGRIIVSTQQFEVARLCTEQPCTISEIEQKWSFDKDLYVFYHKVEATRITGSEKAESSSNGEITKAEEAARDEQQHADKKPTGASKMAAALEEDWLIDRKAAKAKVINFIDQDGEVISICGMGGLGKTTLVTSLYQQELSERFQRRAWLTVPHLNHQEFYNDLLRQLHVDYHGDKEKPVTEAQQSNNGKETQPKKEQKPVDILAEILLEKKCLIVFDDLSSTMEWKLIRQLLPSSKDKTTNRIIVTTRELNVAMCCSEKESKIYNLEFLTEEEALCLFEKKVFKDIKERESYANISGLAEQANLILKKCDGLPLAISTIGSFLGTRPKTAIEWRNLNKHISAELEMNQELGMIKTVLATSYDGLPYYLKACFLYLSIFPEDHRIRWSRLVRRWIAEGYSRRIRDKTAVETGNSYITELINRSMVQPLHDGIESGRNGFLEIHDLIRDIAISKATEENLVFTLDEGCNLNTQGKIRHLAVSSRWKRDKDAFERALDLSHLRSLTVFGRLEAFFISDKMRLLRVLDLEDTKGLTDQHLHQIGKLVHLIYLSLRGCDGHLRLPDSLGNLRQLQTLDVRDVYIINLPETIVKLDKLLYLHVGVVPPDDQKMKGIWDVIAWGLKRFSCSKGLCIGCCCCLPVILLVFICFVVVCLLVLLCYLLFFPGRFLRMLSMLTRDGCAGVSAYIMGIDPSGVKFPRGTGKLKSLHTLGVVNIDGGNTILKELRYLTELRKLRVTGLNNKNRKNFCSAIANLKSLESLFVRSEGKAGLSGCLDGLSEPPNNLQSLKLYGNLVKLPAWIEKLTNLAKMELRSSCISETEVGTTLQVLGKLPNLAILRLWRGSLEGQELCFSFHDNAFPSLKVLALDLLDGIKLVKFEGATATNKLELLEVEFKYWSSLVQYYYRSVGERAEIFSGLPSLPSLKEVVLSRATKKFMDDLRAQFAGKPNQPIVKLKSQLD